LRATGGIGPAGDFEDVALGRVERRGKLIELRFVVACQDALIEAEGHRSRGHLLVAIQVADHARQ
jgi:hypothetical protein